MSSVLRGRIGAMTLPTLLFAEKTAGYYEAREYVPNAVVYWLWNLGSPPWSWTATASNADRTRHIALGHHPDLNAAMKACEAHFLRQRPA